MNLLINSRVTLAFIVSLNAFLLYFLAPGPPSFLPERCSAENNTVTLVWSPYTDSLIDAYILEIDDGAGAGNFRVSYLVRPWPITLRYH